MGEVSKYIDQDYPEMREVTEEMQIQAKKNSHRFRGSVRVANGMFRTTKEYEKWRKKVLKTPLP